LLLQIPPALFLHTIYMDVDPPAAEGNDPKPKSLNPKSYIPNLNCMVKTAVHSSPSALSLQIPPALFMRYIYMDVDPPAAAGDDPKPKSLLILAHPLILALCLLLPSLQIPPALFLRYIYMDVEPPAAEGDDPKPKQKSLELFEDFCTFAFVLSFVMAVGGIACTWLVPDDYNLGQVLNVSLQFFEAQVRILPVLLVPDFWKSRERVCSAKDKSQVRSKHIVSINCWILDVPGVCTVLFQRPLIVVTTTQASTLCPD
jgi:hypothetical protein